MLTKLFGDLEGNKKENEVYVHPKEGNLLRSKKYVWSNTNCAIPKGYKAFSPDQGE